MEGKKRVADGGLQGLDIFGGTERERESVKRMVYHFYKTFPEMRQWNVLPRKAAIVIDKMAESAVSDDRFPESFEPYRDRLEDMGYEVRGPDRFIVLSKSSLKDIKRLYLELTEELTHHFFQAGAVLSYHHWTHFCVIFLASNYLSPNSALIHRFLQSDGAAGAIDAGGDAQGLHVVLDSLLPLYPDDVRDDTRASRKRLPGAMSTKTGVAPTCEAAPAVAKKV